MAGASLQVFNAVFVGLLEDYLRVLQTCSHSTTPARCQVCVGVVRPCPCCEGKLYSKKGGVFEARMKKINRRTALILTGV